MLADLQQHPNPNRMEHTVTNPRHRPGPRRGTPRTGPPRPRRRHDELAALATALASEVMPPSTAPGAIIVQPGPPGRPMSVTPISTVAARVDREIRAATPALLALATALVSDFSHPTIDSPW